MASGYITELTIPGFGGGIELWMDKIGTVEPSSGGGTALSSACFTIVDNTGDFFGSTLVDTAGFSSGQLLCWRKTDEWGEGCGVRLEVTPEFSELQPVSLTFSFQGGAYEFGTEQFFDFSVVFPL